MDATLPVKEYGYIDDVRSDIMKMIPSDGRVIGSVGCGRGRTESVLVERGRDVHGVDVSAEAIATARLRLTSARVMSPDERMPFDEGSLDGLILADVIEHMPLAWERLRLFAMMVKPGGWVVISVPNMRYLDVLHQLVVKGEWREVPMGIFDETHVQVMTHKRLNRWCEAAGLEVQQWFDRYDHRFVHRNVYRILNHLTFKRCRSFFTIEVQGVFRRAASLGVPSAATGGAS
ncbi:MAG: class I SAM-dependent methyltransferase [Thiobacillus sp.]